MVVGKISVHLTMVVNIPQGLGWSVFVFSLVVGKMSAFVTIVVNIPQGLRVVCFFQLAWWGKWVFP